MKILLALALTLGMGVAAAADLSSVGTTGVEGTVDYGYTRSINTPYWLSGHDALVGVQVNAGILGSVVVETGDTQRVTDYRLNYTTFEVGYANGVKLGAVSLVGAVAYTSLTSDLWFPSGKNGTTPINGLTGVAEVNAPLAGAVKVFAD